MEIKFIAKDRDTEACVPSPVRSANAVPEWFKNTPLAAEGEGTSKACPPFVDAFTTGYIQKLWCDVEFADNGRTVYFDSKYAPVTIKKNNPQHVPIFDGFESVELQWNTHWEPVTPEGYSALYVHPLNQYNLPFMTFSGIIDTDKFSLTGPLRFLLKSGFNGVIKSGTPLYQIIPLKRDKWNSQSNEYDYEILKDQNNKLHNYKFEHKHNAYKRLFWQKKEYK